MRRVVIGLWLAGFAGCTYDFTIGDGSGSTPTADSGATTGTSCTEGDCTCKVGESCSLSCPAVACSYICGTGSSCSTSCTGGKCATSCAAGARCNVSCTGGGCSTACAAGSECTIACPGGGCTTTCATGATCKIPNCTSCTCIGAGCS